MLGEENEILSHRDVQIGHSSSRGSLPPARLGREHFLPLSHCVLSLGKQNYYYYYYYYMGTWKPASLPLERNQEPISVKIGEQLSKGRLSCYQKRLKSTFALSLPPAFWRHMLHVTVFSISLRWLFILSHFNHDYKLFLRNRGICCKKTRQKSHFSWLSIRMRFDSLKYGLY